MIRPLKIFGPSCRRHNKAHTVVQAGGQADRGERGKAARTASGKSVLSEAHNDSDEKPRPIYIRPDLIIHVPSLVSVRDY
jgi:hypothetical protein